MGAASYSDDPQQTDTDVVADASRETAQTASQETRAAAETAKQQTREVAATATQGARQVADQAKQQAQNVAQEATRQVRDLASQARDQLRDQAESQTRRAGDALRQLSDQTRALAEGRTEEAGPATELLSRFSDRIGDISSRLDEGGFQGIIADVEGFARRRPALFLGLAAAAGFAVSRLARAAKDEGDGGYASGDGFYETAPAYSSSPAMSGLEAPAFERDALLAPGDAMGPGPVGPVTLPDIEPVRGDVVLPEESAEEASRTFDQSPEI